MPPETGQRHNNRSKPAHQTPHRVASSSQDSGPPVAQDAATPALKKRWGQSQIFYQRNEPQTTLEPGSPAPMQRLQARKSATQKREELLRM
jgi:hypothetical protein